MSCNSQKIHFLREQIPSFECARLPRLLWPGDHLAGRNGPPAAQDPGRAGRGDGALNCVHLGPERLHGV
jgi:hypothetical protein